MLNKTTDQNLAVPKGIDLSLSLTIDTIETMPHVLCSFLDISRSLKVQNERDYLNDYFSQVKKKYENYDLQISSSEKGHETIDNKVFSNTRIIIKGENFLAYQKRYSIKINNKL